MLLLAGPELEAVTSADELLSPLGDGAAEGSVIESAADEPALATGEAGVDTAPDDVVGTGTGTKTADEEPLMTVNTVENSTGSTVPLAAGFGGIVVAAPDEVGGEAGDSAPELGSVAGVVAG